MMDLPFIRPGLTAVLFPYSFWPPATNEIVKVNLLFPSLSLPLLPATGAAACL